MTKPAKPARITYHNLGPYPDQPKSRPKTPRNVWRRPVKLPRVEPLTDADREAA